MKVPPTFLRQFSRDCGRAAAAFAVWSLWLALALVLLVQVWILLAQELTVPGFLMRRLERAIAETGVRAECGEASFDPNGRVVLENVRLSLPEFPETIVRVRAVYCQFSPWALAAGRFNPREIRLSGASAAVPAMLAPTGRSEEVVQDLEATLVPDNETLRLVRFSARIAGIAVSARGAVMLPPRGRARSPESIAEMVSTGFPRLCRQINTVRQQLTALEEPALDLELVPSDTRTAVVNATLTARGLNLEQPLTAHLGALRITTRLPLVGDPPASSQLELVADEIRLPFQASARKLRATLLGRFLPGGYRFEPRELQVAADGAEAAGYSAAALSAQLFPQPLPRLEAAVVSQLMGAPLEVRASADFTTRSADLRFTGAISPTVLTPLSDQLGVDVRKYFDFATLQCLGGEARLGPDWKFQKVTARVAVQGINAYQVHLDEGVTTVELAGTRFHAPEAYGRIGENFAYGSYEQDLQTREFRFLLQGRLRPLAIGGWFGDWWPGFFNQFAFPAAPPEASVDVAGFWREGRRTTVFVAADAARPVIRGAALDRVRTRLFIRPYYFDGLDLTAQHGGGEVRGTFTYLTNPETHEWRSLDLNLTSSVDPALAATLIGPDAAPTLSLFKFARPPDLKLKGRIDGADAPQGAHQNLQLQLMAPGEFRFQGFPVDDASFEANIRDDEVVVENFLARFAGGAATGRAKVWGVGAQRRLGFDVALKDASLGQTVNAVQNYLAELKKLPPEPPGKFVQEKANVRLDLAVSGEGRYSDPLSYTGGGSATVRGEELGEVPLLGLLSSLLKFTALRFTSANANFKLNQAKLEFSDVAVRGANSAIDAHGDYRLDLKELNFKAKIFPFQESSSLLKTVVGVVLTPVSNVFEVKLTGSLEKPEWAFVIGPTNFLRSLVPGANEPSPAATAPGTGATPAPGAPVNPASPDAPASKAETPAATDATAAPASSAVPTPSTPAAGKPATEKPATTPEAPPPANK